MTKWLLLASLALSVAAVYSGCALVPRNAFRDARCTRVPFPGQPFNVLVCDDEAVNRHCHKWNLFQGSKNRVLIPRKKPGTLDQGGAITDKTDLAGCYDKKGTWRGNAMVGYSYQGCAFHEIAHGITGLSPAEVDRKYKCVGDRK